MCDLLAQLLHLLGTEPRREDVRVHLPRTAAPLLKGQRRGSPFPRPHS
jgi:hypothetical protein